MIGKHHGIVLFCLVHKVLDDGIVLLIIFGEFTGSLTIVDYPSYPDRADVPNLGSARLGLGYTSAAILLTEAGCLLGASTLADTTSSNPRRSVFACRSGTDRFFRVQPCDGTGAGQPSRAVPRGPPRIYGYM
ncbi:hypothetical protein HBH45_124180 [Parastagonospora nodorum]|nr:hypothetical protein HBH51_173010 [Parastagonospora nodorum]KAH4137044.1 hypothetical protein HBH45_124180 [Parastagonospora nodorum]KAH4569025.1 hypothetical protein HBH84_125620 [Parastagonospora nodorum]KAH4862771.1 hypothetical protein HBH75_016590 [Parastagonospora nodorum]